MIAFPKTKSACDPMTGAPLPAAEDQLKLLHLQHFGLEEEAKA